MKLKNHFLPDSPVPSRNSPRVLTIHSHPFIEVLPLGKLDRQPEIPRAQGGRRVLHQVILVRALGDVLLRFERLVGAAAAAGERVSR